MYEDFAAMKDKLAICARTITKSGLPKDFSPMVFAVTGTGRVSQGIMEVLEQLPHDKVHPDHLQNYLSQNHDNHKIVLT